MSKRREFWIKTCDYIPDRAVSTMEEAKCTAGCNHTPIHVCEVSPGEVILDPAEVKMVTNAMADVKLLGAIFRQPEIDLIKKLKSALKEKK